MNEIKKEEINKDMETLKKTSIWNEQFNISNKNLNQRLGEQNGASWK
jgi:hypothetical protein